MSSISIKIILRTENLRKDGSCGLYLQFISDRKKTRLFLGEYLYPKKGYSFNKINDLPVSSSKGTKKCRLDCFPYDGIRITKGGDQHLNSFLDAERERARQIVSKHHYLNKLLTVEQFKNEFSKKVKYEYAHDYFVNQVRQMQNIANETRRTYYHKMTKLNDFREMVSLQDINYSFLKEYETYCLKPKTDGGLGNKRITYKKDIKLLKQLLNDAVKKGDYLVTTGSFKEYEFTTKFSKKEQTPRDFLNEEEKSIYIDLFERYQPVPVGKVMRQEDWEFRVDNKIVSESEYKRLIEYLFACETGLRFRDCTRLNYNHFKHVSSLNLSESFGFDYFLFIDLHKTGQYITIPLTDFVFELLDKYGNSFDIAQIGKSDELIFSMRSNQKTNEKIKGLLSKYNLSIDKNLPFHTSRHTFAVNAINKGMPLKVVQDVLGHQNHQTTEIYAKIMPKYVFQEMSKLNTSKENKPSKSDDLVDRIKKLSDVDQDKLNKIIEAFEL